MTWEDSPYRLLVEGPDDKHSVIHLMRRHGVDWDDATALLPCVHCCGGFDPLISSLGVWGKSYRRLGIMVDANADMARRWVQVRESLGRVGISVPESPEVCGTVFPGIYPDWKIGVWIMPDNQNAGELEDFLSKLVPPDDACWDYACEATSHAREIGARFPQKDFCKASIHTWLAWQEEPGLPFGTAITAKYFGVDSPEAMSFVQWFRELFS